jgi:hypothetical protein
MGSARFVAGRCRSILLDGSDDSFVGAGRVEPITDYEAGFKEGEERKCRKEPPAAIAH